MELLKTSKVINSLYQNRDTKITLSYENFVVEQYGLLFEIFLKNNSNFKFKNVMQLNQYFNYFISENAYENFQKVHIIEYFNKSLNFVIVSNFLKSFNKGNPNVDEKTLGKHDFMFNSFYILNQFYKFCDFLCLNKDFLHYLQSLIILYCLSLDRTIIETYFSNTLSDLDDYFQNNIFINLCIELNYKKINDFKNKLIKLTEKYSEKIQQMDKTIDYTSSEYDYIDNKFCETDDGNIVCISDDSDINIFLYRLVQQTEQTLIKIHNEINIFNVGINKYHGLLALQNNDFEVMKIITMIGIEMIDYSKLDELSLERLFQMAYNMGFLHIIKKITDCNNFKLSQTIYDIIADRNELPPLATLITNTINKYLALKYKDNQEFLSHIAKGNFKLTVKQQDT